jgi:uncharacterized membrane protein
MTRRMGIALLSLAGVFLSTYLAMYKLGYIGELTCSVGSCEVVQMSSWAELLGVPVAVWGVAFYATLFVVAFVGTLEKHVHSSAISMLLLTLTGWGVAFSGWLTYLELFVIDAICMWCVVSAILAVVLFALAVMERREHVPVSEADSAEL